MRVKFKHEGHRNNLVTYLCALGYTHRVKGSPTSDVNVIVEDALYNSWPNLVIYPETKRIDFSRSNSDATVEWPKDSTQIIVYAYESLALRVILNKDYTAEVNHAKNTVKVGCQTIPFSAIEELYKVMKNPQ